IHAAIEGFVADYPNNPHFRRVPFVDAPTFLNQIALLLRPGYEEKQAIGTRVRLGELPYGLLAAAISKPYAAVLLERAAGILVAREFDPVSHDAEVQSAAATIDGSVVVDTSALATMAGVRDLWTLFVSAFHRILSSDLQLADAY